MFNLETVVLLVLACIFSIAVLGAAYAMDHRLPKKAPAPPSK
jgi:hypothetical protein